MLTKCPAGHCTNRSANDECGFPSARPSRAPPYPGRPPPRYPARAEQNHEGLLLPGPIALAGTLTPQHPPRPRRFLLVGFSIDNNNAEQANKFCSYPDSATEAYREPSVCSNNADPCMKDGEKLTLDDFTAQDWASPTTSTLWNASFTLLFISYVVALLGVVIKNKMISKIAAFLIVFVIVVYTVCWIIGWSTGPQYTELEGAERQYWQFWKFAYCNDTDPSTGKAYADFDTVRVARMDTLKSMDVEPLHAMDDETYGPVSTNNDPLWCSSVPADPAWGRVDLEHGGQVGPADTYAVCPSRRTASSRRARSSSSSSCGSSTCPSSCGASRGSGRRRTSSARRRRARRPCRARRERDDDARGGGREATARA